MVLRSSAQGESFRWLHVNVVYYKEVYQRKVYVRPDKDKCTSQVLWYTRNVRSMSDDVRWTSVRVLPGDDVERWIGSSDASKRVYEETERQ